MIQIEKLPLASAQKHAASWGSKIATDLATRCRPLAATYPQLNALVTYLTTNIEDKLAASPAGLRAQIAHVRTNFPQLDAIFAKSKKSRTPSEKALGEAFEKSYRYDKFSEAPTDGAYQLVGAYGLRICPYCQGSHINYHQNTPKEKMRPALDHFYPASRYPFLAVSFYNLIPSCHQCNSSVKRNLDPYPGAPHPLELNEDDIVFEVKASILSKAISTLRPDDIELTITATTRPAEEHLKLFRLRQRYAWYKPELFDVCRRSRQWDDAKGPLHGLLTREEFVCGFDAADGKSRILGRCLSKVSEQLAGLLSP